jgi:hypothetical protein
MYIVGAVALVAAAALTGCASGQNTGSTPIEATPAATSAIGGAPITQATSSAAAAPAKTRTTTAAKANVSQLRSAGIGLGKSVLIDVADDGVDRFLAIGKDGVVDFTGTSKTDSTMMSLKAAPGGRENQVLIQPPFWNEDLGKGSCVADTSGAALTLETCAAGNPAQIWTVVPAGDSGQFELLGKYGMIRVDHGKITTGTSGRSGLQTISFAK